VGLLTGVGNLTFNVLVARLTGADAYGTFVALMTLATVAGVLAVGTNYTVARRIARADTLNPALIRQSLMSSWPWLLVGCALLASTPLLQNFLHLRSPAAVLTGVAVFTVIVVAAAPAGILIGRRRFRALALLNCAGAAARLAALPLVARSGDPTAVALGASALPSLVVGCGALAAVLSRRGVDTVWRTVRSGDDDEGRLSLETMGAALLAAMLWSLWSLPPLLARHSLGGAAAGNFSAAQLLAGGILFVSAPSITAFFPLTARGRTLRVAVQALAALLALCFCGVAALALLGPHVVPLLYGSQYTAPLSLLAALGISAALVACANFCAWMARAMHRLVWVAFAGSAAAVAAELTVGVLLHPSALGLAVLPASAIVFGLAVVIVVLPETVYIAVIRTPAAAWRRFGEGLPHTVAATTLARIIRLPAHRLLAVFGITALLAVGVTGQSSGAASVGFAALALVALAAATLVALRASRGVRDGWERTRERAAPWLWSFVIVAASAAATAQTWFRPGTAIAGTDLAPPAGTAWLSRLFDPWSWSGSDIGGAAANERSLPWATVLGTVHALGGSAALAQRIWLTLLYVGMGVAAVALLRALGLRPLAAAMGGFVYLFNAQTLLSVPNDVYLLALGLLPALVAIILAAARGTVRIRTAAVLMVLTVPLAGYVTLQPSLALVLVLGVLLCPLLAAWLGGRDALLRALRVVGLGGGLMLVASAFFVVPAATRLSAASTGRLADLSSWSWTEGRASLSNGFWLNTAWGWDHPEYYPFASAYSRQPLLFLKFVLPALAFLALLVPAAKSPRAPREGLLLRIAALGAAIALIVIVFCTGTNLPGALVFDPLYHLPLGFLLREPDAHFLWTAALAYAVLVGVGVDYAARRLAGLRLRLRHRVRVAPRAALVAAGVGLAALSPGYPLLTGAVVSDSRPTLPPRHVTVPGYWNDMASFINGLRAPGDILVLPADHFYQVDYTWGFYGVDTFIPDLVARRVILPLPQGYIGARPQLLAAVNQVDDDIVAGDWRGLQSMSSALRTPFILVRGDVNPSFLSLSDVPEPASLAAALKHAAGVRLVKVSGPLQLFSVAGVPTSALQTAPVVATVNSDAPDLRVLSHLPPGTHLVTEGRTAGLTSVVEVPPITSWQPAADAMQTRVPAPPGWRYQVVALNQEQGARTTVRATVAGSSLQIAVPTLPILSGAFTSGPVQPVDACGGGGAEPSGSRADVLTQAGPGGVPALRLAVKAATACVHEPLQWQGGPIALSLRVRTLSGRAPRFCVREVGLDSCAAAARLPESSGWASYAGVITPAAGARGLELFLYADGGAGAATTVDLVADLSVTALPAPAPRVDVIATPLLSDGAPRLVIQDETYDQRWSGPQAARHVMVDGLLNGWLTRQPGKVDAGLSYAPGAFNRAADVVSIAAGLVTAGLGIWALTGSGTARRLQRRLQRPRPPASFQG
jgi:O-antigen/teichoic acid export membrane protein